MWPALELKTLPHSPMNTHPAISYTARFAPLILTLAYGCSAPINETNGLLLSGDTEPPAMRASEPDLALPNDQPSLTQGFNRSHWKRTNLRLPQAAVGVYPNYTMSALRNPRHAGAFPTSQSSLDGGLNPGMQLLNGFIDPGVVIFDVVALPVHLFMTPPWSVQEEPAGNFRLLPETPMSTP